MDILTAKPGLLKQANLSRIRKVIRIKHTATRSEIARETQISSTTIRSLLTEMLRNGEIEIIGYDESSGGRKAARYRLCPDCYYGAALCITNCQISGLLVDMCGEIIESKKLDIIQDDSMLSITTFLDEVMQKWKIRSIGIGVPGIVENGSYQYKIELTEKWIKQDIGNILTQKYGLPVILENDINAIVVGFEHSYIKKFPHDDPDNTNMAYLHFQSDCVSAGFISGGRLIRGYHNYAGELSLIPLDNDVLLDECFAQPIDDDHYITLMVRILGCICGILNPEYIILGGPALRKNCIAPINDRLSALLPECMVAEVIYSPDAWHDYQIGMARLTAGKMFEEIQFVRE